MFLSQIASACHYLHSRHIVHGNLRALYVYVESPDKVMFWLYISHECVIVFPSKYDQHARMADPEENVRHFLPYIYIPSFFSRFVQNN